MGWRETVGRLDTRRTTAPLPDRPGFFSQSLFGRPGLKDLYFFCVALYECVNAGLPLVRAFDVAVAGARNRQLYKAAQGTVKDLAAGIPIEKALSARPKVFSRMFVAVFMGGLRSGSLPLSLAMLRDHYQWVRTVRFDIVRVAVYPLFLMFIGPIILIATEAIIRVIGGGELGWRVIVSMFWRYLGFPVSGGLAAYLIVRILRLRPLRPATDFLVLRLPVFGKLYFKYCMARFFCIYACGLDAGCSLISAYRDALAALDSAPLARRMQSALAFLEANSPIWEALEATALFDKSVLGLIRVGEEAYGSPGSLMRHIAKQYLFEVRTYLRALVTAFFLLTLLLIAAYGFFVVPKVLFLGYFLVMFLFALTLTF